MRRGRCQSCIVWERCTFGEVSCMQVIPFLCVFILDGAIFGDGVKKFVSALLYYMTEGWRLLRWGLGVVPAITYHCNAVPVPRVYLSSCGKSFTFSLNHKRQKLHICIYRIWNEFSFHTVFMKLVVCFYIPQLIKQTTDTFYHMLNSQIKKQEKHSLIEFYYRFYCGKSANVGALPIISQTIRHV